MKNVFQEKTKMKNGIRKIINKNGVSYSFSVPTGKRADGTYGQKWYTVNGSITNAKTKRAEIITNMKNGTYIEPGKITVTQYLNKWLDECARPNLAPRTVEGYETVINRHLIPDLGIVLLTKLKPEHIAAYYKNKLTNGRIRGKGALDPATVLKHHLVLHCALENALK
jgi:hypothetical protein